MKKLSVLILLFSAVVCHGEIVSEVSFNPSRMGDYRYLKVADSASLVGGLVTNDLNISSGETVIMKLDSTAPQSFNISGGGTAETNPRSVDGASGSAIDMPSTVFRGSSSAYIPNVYVRGGEGTFTGGNSVVDNTMNGNYVLLQKAKTLSGGAVEIAGDASKATIDLHSAGSTAGFWLHGNDIPNPKRSASLQGASSISSCTLTWEERTTAETTPKKVKVLSLANCTIGGSSGGSSGETPKKTQKGKYVVGGSEYDTFSWQSHMHYSPTFSLCSSSNISSQLTSRAAQMLTGVFDLPQASAVCDAQCNGVAGIPNGTRTCSGTWTHYNCSFFNGGNTYCSSGGSSLPGASTALQIGYHCNKITVRCYEE